MNLKDKLVSSFMVFEDFVDIKEPIHDIRTEAIKIFEEKGFPTKKDEFWKYTSLNRVLKDDYSIFPKNRNRVRI